MIDAWRLAGLKTVAEGDGRGRREGEGEEGPDECLAHPPACDLCMQLMGQAGGLVALTKIPACNLQVDFCGCSLFGDLLIICCLFAGCLLCSVAADRLCPQQIMPHAHIHIFPRATFSFFSCEAPTYTHAHARARAHTHTHTHTRTHMHTLLPCQGDGSAEANVGRL